MYLVCFAVTIVSIYSIPLPSDVISAIANGYFNHNSIDCPLIDYNYGTAITFDSLYQTIIQYPTNSSLDFNANISYFLNRWLFSDKLKPAYRIYHNDTISFNSIEESAIGDVVGLFPITYLESQLYNNNMVINLTNPQWHVILTTANYYVLQYPRNLRSYNNDSTISRDNTGHWKHETSVNHSVVWADDNYMGTTLLSRMCILFQSIITYPDQYKVIYPYNMNITNLSEYASIYQEFVLDQNELFPKHLFDNNNNLDLYSHAYNAFSGDNSCCFWGRANGWALIAQIEALNMLKLNNNNSKQRQNIIGIYQKHINAIALLQDNLNNTGRWHQVLNESSTFLETSASASFLRAIIYAKLNGFLPTNVFNEAQWEQIIQNAWIGLVDMIDLKTGKIEMICDGTPIENDVRAYNDRPTLYCRSGNPGGVGFVINAALAYDKYINRI